MTDELTNTEQQRFCDARERVIECINEMVDDGFKGHEIYVGLAAAIAIVLGDGVPDLEERAFFVRMIGEKAMER